MLSGAFLRAVYNPGMAHGRDAAHRDWYDDTFYGNMDAIGHHDTSWHMLTTLVEQVVDLRHETLQ